ncbi:helix-turn-helix transcriptional regulator [Alicyclobacillus sp.]|uniref:helix-turn-helix domain-containing protein n=1 Tax=Alicyclobacillus sp. TaxID=61169 RepID=UPI0034599235
MRTLAGRPRTKLRQMREERGLTLQQVADAVGISKPYLWQIENGKRGLSYALAVKIASVFGTNPDEVFLADELTTEEHTA